jgi:uncharacterized membrane protein
MTNRRDSSGSRFFRTLLVLTRRTDQRSRGFGHWLRARLVVGLLVAFPLVVTVFFARFIFGLLDRWFRPISEHFFGFPLVGGGLLLAVIGLLLLGIISTNVIGGRLLGIFESRITDLPLLSPIYQGARQITEAIQARGTTDFRRVVLIRFPHQEMRSLGFVTRDFRGPTEFADEPSALVFVPTTPNPTSGFLVAALQRNLKTLDISVEEGVKLVISGGLLTPDVLLHGSVNSSSLPPGEQSNPDAPTTDE